MNRTTTETMDGAALMHRIEEILGEHQQRIVAHLSKDELQALLEYVADHDRLAHSHLLPATLDFIRARLTI